jgi:hypothetical protein
MLVPAAGTATRFRKRLEEESVSSTMFNHILCSADVTPSSIRPVGQA